MRLVVQPQELKLAYNAVSRAVSSKPVMPALGGILILPAGDGKVTLTASDEDMVITTSMDIIEADGVVPTLIPAERLASYVKSAMGGWEVSIETAPDDPKQITISDMIGDFSFYSDCDASEYPKGKEMKDGFTKEIDAMELLSVTTAAKGFAANDDVRPVLTGVCYDFLPDGLRVVATDSKTMFRDIIRSVTSEEQHTVIVSRKMIGAVTSIFTASSPVTVSFDANTIRFHQGGVDIVGRLIEGRFPRYDVVIPKNNDRVAEFDINTLQSGIRRVLIGANASTSQVVFTFDGSSTLKLEGRDIDFSVSATASYPTLSQENISNGFALALRGTFLSDILSTFPKSVKSAAMLMADPNRAVLIKSEKDADRVTLIMPMQMI